MHVERTGRGIVATHCFRLLDCALVLETVVGEHLVGSSTQSRCRRTVKGRITLPYSDCL